MAVMYYITAHAMPRGATELPAFRTDMAKFFTRKDAESHLEKLRGPAFANLAIEEREDPEAGTTVAEARRFWAPQQK